MGLFSSIFKTVGKVASVAAPFISETNPALGAAASALGTMYANKQKQEYNDRVNQQSIELANTAHQREVADLKAAGLNPILSANAGAQTPGLTVAQIDDPSKTSTAAYSTAKQLQLQQKEAMSRIDLNSANAEKARSEKKLVEQQAVSEMLNQDLIRAKSALTDSQRNQVDTYVKEHMPVILDKMREEIAKIKDERVRIRVMNALDETTMWEKMQMVQIAASHVAVAQQNAASNRISANAAAKDAQNREDSGYWKAQADKSSADTTNTNVDTVRDLIDIGLHVIEYIPMRR